MNFNLDFTKLTLSPSASRRFNAVLPLTRAFQAVASPFSQRIEAARPYYRAARETFADKSNPLEGIPKPVIDHSEIQFTHHQANGSTKTALIFLGHKTSINEAEQVFDEFYQAGISTLVVPLPAMNGHVHANDGRRIDVAYRDHIKIAAQKLCEKIASNQEITIITHSSSGAALERAMQEDDDFAQFIANNTSQIIHLAAFLETAGSSFLVTPSLSRAYSFASSTPWLRDKRTGETALDRLWLKIPENVDKAQYLDSIKGNARHGQAGALKAGAQQHLKVVMKNPDPESCFQNLKRTFLVGSEDTASCPETTQFYADKFVKGATCEVLEDLGHDLLGNAQFRQQLIQSIEAEGFAKNPQAALASPLSALQPA